jgi:hypothetical protein
MTIKDFIVPSNSEAARWDKFFDSLTEADLNLWRDVELHNWKGTTKQKQLVLSGLISQHLPEISTFFICFLALNGRDPEDQTWKEWFNAKELILLSCISNYILRINAADEAV